MAITQKTIKILWSESAGRCAYPECLEKLCSNEAGDFAPFTIGEMAHICGEKPGSNRHNPNQTPEQRDDYANLILLCPTHHTRIDRKENEKAYSVDVLLKMKAEHESFVSNRLEKMTFKDKQEAAKQIVTLLVENHEVWSQFGPHSEIARKNPHSKDAHAIWVSERLSTIVPNNRQIKCILENSRNLFSAEEQKAISSFLVHARSYERWVQDELSYEAVIRFPKEFDNMIERITNASA